jgi:hypothetical protein
VIGDEGDIKRIYENLGVSSLHMRHLSKRDKRDIINRLEINGHVLATCLNVGRSFLTSQGTILSDVIFEVDQDFRKPLSHLGLKRNAEAKFAYTIADVIANCNYTGKHISKVLEKNLFIGLKDSISRRLRL